MKNFKFFSISLALIGASLFSSCLNDKENEYTSSDSLPGFFNVFVDQDGEMTIKEDVSYKITWTYSGDTKANVDIVGLKLPDGSKYSTVQFLDLPWKINTRGWQAIEATNPTPSGGQSIVFDKFSLQMINRYYNSYQFPPCTSIQYTINGNEYYVYSLPSQIIEVGETTVINQADPSAEAFVKGTDDSPFYYFILNPADQTAFIVIQGAQFAQNMPAMNMKFPGLKFEVDPYGGTVMMKGNDITPTLMTGVTDINAAGTPFEGAKINNLWADYRPLSGVDLQFDCTYSTQATPDPVTYHVRFSVAYPSTEK